MIDSGELPTMIGKLVQSIRLEVIWTFTAVDWVWQRQHLFSSRLVCTNKMVLAQCALMIAGGVAALSTHYAC